MEKKENNKTITLMEYSLKAGLKYPMYYVGFPAEWKRELLRLRDLAYTPKETDMKYLNTSVLGDVLTNWMDGTVRIDRIGTQTEDSHWLASFVPFTDKRLEQLLFLVKLWVRESVIPAKKRTETIEEELRTFLSSMDWHVLKPLTLSEKTVITYENGEVHPFAYSLIPSMIAKKLTGRKVTVSGRELVLNYAGGNELFTDPIGIKDNDDSYSLVVSFALQTAPPDGKNMLLCNLSCRRWIRIPWNTEKAPFLSESCSAHVKVADHQFCKLSLQSFLKKTEDEEKATVRRTEWDEFNRRCYNVFYTKELVDPEVLLKNPENYREEVLLPYKNGMKGFSQPVAGTGIPINDKEELYLRLAELIDDFITQDYPTAQIVGRRKKIPFYDSPMDYKTREDFRRWAKSCADTDRLVFEIYGLLEDSNQRKLMEDLQKKIWEDFGENTNGSCMDIDVILKEIGSLADPVVKDETEDITSAQVKNSRRITRILGKTEDCIGAIVVIPAAEFYSKEKVIDPKVSMRHGFACSGRVVQFIHPQTTVEYQDKDGNKKKKIVPGNIEMKQKVIHSVYDLYRQLGIVALIDRDRRNHLPNTECYGIYIMKKIPCYGSKNIGDSLPVRTQFDLSTGRVMVSCPAFTRKMPISYRKACLETAQLYWKDAGEFEKQKSQARVTEMLSELKILYQDTENSAFVTVSSENARYLWTGITDKEIKKYKMSSDFCPEKIIVGDPWNKKESRFLKTGVRIVRFRLNAEVPDYFTPYSTKAEIERNQRAAMSGIFIRNNVFYSIGERPGYDDRYIRSTYQRKLDNGEQFYAEKSTIEIYPIQLQPDDRADEWVYLADALRYLPIQCNMATNLPLPLHLASCLQEYVFMK